MWERAARHVAEREPLNCVYIHVPFCKSICHFCNYDRLQPSSPHLLETWLARVLRSLDVMGPALQPLTFHALYIGGGTPSVLPARMLRTLLEALDKTLRWDPESSRKMEFDPAVMNRERLDVLAAHRFHQLSFGLETLDPEVNIRHNRGRQSIETIERCFTEMRAVGIDDVACDFLLGLEGTTPEGMLVEMETVLQRFQPAWLDIFMLTPTETYVDTHFGGSWEAFWTHLRPFESLIPAALPELAARTGYRVRMGQGHHLMLSRDRNGATGAKGRYSYTALTTECRRPLNVLGLGRSARSVIFGTAAFASRDPEDNPAKAGPADYAGNAIDMRDEARTFLSHYLRDRDTVDRAEFRAIFGADIAELLPRAVAAWASEGTARLEDDVLRFVPQERRERIRTLLWLVPQEAIEFDLAHFYELELTPSGIARLVEAIRPGAHLGAGYVFGGADGNGVLLRAADGQTLRFRVAPGLSDAAPIRLVLQGTATPDQRRELQHAASQLCRMITARHRDLTHRSGDQKRGGGAQRHA